MQRIPLSLVNVFYYCYCDSGQCLNVSCVPLAPSFSEFLPLARHSFFSSLNLILDHLWKSEFSELTGNPWVMGTFFPFSLIPILPRRKHIQRAEWEVPSCWTPKMPLLRTPSNFLDFHSSFWIKCFPHLVIFRQSTTFSTIFIPYVRLSFT